MTQRFTAPSNSATPTETQALAEALSELSGQIGLTLMEDVRFNLDESYINYNTRILKSGTFENRTLFVHPEDVNQFIGIRDDNEAALEFRVIGSDQFDTILLTLHGNTGPFTWQAGSKVRLRQPRKYLEVIARQARMAELGHIAASIGHELKQPLFTISIAAENAQMILDSGNSKPPHEEVQKRLARIVEQTQRATAIIDSVSGYTRNFVDSDQKADVRDVYNKVYRFLAKIFEDRAITVDMEFYGENFVAQIDVLSLEQVIVNAVQNAADSIKMRREKNPDASGKINMIAKSLGNMIFCEIKDNGIGLPPAIAASVFDPYFTTKESSGTGLGLFISRGIISKAGGTITLEGHKRGASLKIAIPAANETDSL